MHYSKLNACQFCASSLIHVVGCESISTYVRCKNCEAKTGTYPKSSDAITAWNSGHIYAGKQLKPKKVDMQMLLEHAASLAEKADVNASKSLNNAATATALVSIAKSLLVLANAEYERMETERINQTLITGYGYGPTTNIISTHHFIDKGDRSCTVCNLYENSSDANHWCNCDACKGEKNETHT